MAGARARKIDLSGYLSGQSNVARIIANTGAAEGAGIEGLLSGIGSGVSTLGQNLRNDARQREMRAEREAERTYQRGQDQLRMTLAQRADARAERDQQIQEDEAKRKVAADAKAVEETAMWLARAKASMATGMPLDPQVMDGIQKRASVIQSSGGPAAILGRAATQVEEDPEGLISETARMDTLSKILLQQMGREKNPQRHAALGDSLLQLEGVIAANKKRIEIHDANTKRKGEAEEDKAKAEAKAAKESEEWAREADILEKLPRFQALPSEAAKDAARAMVRDRIATAMKAAEEASFVKKEEPTAEETAAKQAKIDDTKARLQGVPTDADVARKKASDEAEAAQNAFSLAMSEFDLILQDEDEKAKYNTPQKKAALRKYLYAKHKVPDPLAGMSDEARTDFENLPPAEKEKVLGSLRR